MYLYTFLRINMIHIHVCKTCVISYMHKYMSFYHTQYKHLIGPDTENQESQIWDSLFLVSIPIKHMVRLNVYTGYSIKYFPWSYIHFPYPPIFYYMYVDSLYLCLIGWFCVNCVEIGLFDTLIVIFWIKHHHKQRAIV
jgi:hypothetical protein